MNSTADTANATDSYLSLREAIAIVNSATLPNNLSSQILAQINGTLHDGSADTIQFDPTQVTGPIVLGTQLELSLPSTTATITISGSAGVTVKENGGSRVFQVDGPTIGPLGSKNVTAVFSNLTLMGGTADRGGGLLNGGTLTLNNCTITGNNSIAGNSNIKSNGGNGGGLANYGTATLTNCTVSGNTASNNNSGGGLYNASGNTLFLNSCTVSGNTATGNNGGGLFNSGTATLSNSTLSGNSATRRRRRPVRQGQPMTLTGCTFSRQHSVQGRRPVAAIWAARPP